MNGEKDTLSHHLKTYDANDMMKRLVVKYSILTVTAVISTFIAFLLTGILNTAVFVAFDQRCPLFKTDQF